jgi:hypothetical protein
MNSDMKNVKHPNLVDMTKPEVFGPGVYFLISRGFIVYVGKSVNVASRVGQHLMDDAKQFDSIKVLSLPESDLEAVEKFLIYKFKPELNKSLGRGPRAKCRATISDIMPALAECILEHESREQTRKQLLNHGFTLKRIRKLSPVAREWVSGLIRVN